MQTPSSSEHTLLLPEQACLVAAAPFCCFVSPPSNTHSDSMNVAELFSL